MFAGRTDTGSLQPGSCRFRDVTIVLPSGA